MSRPLRVLLSGVFLIAAVALSSCVGTIYDRTYSYQKNYFKPAKEKQQVSAETILGALDKKPDANAGLGADNPSGPPGGLPPAADVPGLAPPAGLPDPNAPAPGAPGAPAAPAIPGVPPAVPPPGTPPK